MLSGRFGMSFSYLQGILDSERRMGRFILTGSQQFGMIEAITQSLAGRVSLLSLWPFSLSELQDANRAPVSLDTLLHAGLFPPIHDRPVDPDAWLQSYVATYLERDVRMSINVKDLATFQRFLQSIDACAIKIPRKVPQEVAAAAHVAACLRPQCPLIANATHLLSL